MLVASALSAKIISALNGIDKPQQAGVAFGNAVIGYIAQNVEATYSWTAASSSTPPVPDPTTSCAYYGAANPTAPYTHPSGATETTAALAAVSGALNAAIATMILTLVDKTFAINPVMIIPSIAIKQSNATTQKAAIDALSQDIIDGIKAATPAIAGTHAGVYTGAGAFVSIK